MKPLRVADRVYPSAMLLSTTLASAVYALKGKVLMRDCSFENSSTQSQAVHNPRYVVLSRVHNKNKEGECLTANAACTKSLHMLEGIHT